MTYDSTSSSVTHAHDSVWHDIELVETSPLEADISVDICIVGAGIAGLLTAERLMDEGFTVAVLDAGRVASGETCRTTAHLVTALDDRYTRLELMHGADGAYLAAKSHAAAIGHIERLIEGLRIDCDWRRVDGYLLVNEPHREWQETLIADEIAAAQRSGLTVERISRLPAPWPDSFGPAIRFPLQAQMHPLKFVNALTHHLMSRGVQIYTGTHVRDIHGGDQAKVDTDHGPSVHCKHVVVATNTPVNNLVTVHTKQSGYQTYVMAFRIPAGSLTPLLLWDGMWENDISYHYVRLHTGHIPGHDLLIVGGEDHKTGQGPDGDKPFRCIEEWTREKFPMAGEVEQRWSGEVMEPADGLAYIGHNAMGHKNVYVVTGDSGNGMTHGAIAALLIPDLILGRENPWEKLYDPARKIGMHSLMDYARENLNTVAQYRDWLRSGDVQTIEAIVPGEGAIISHGLRHEAVYKSESGEVTRLSAMCTHLGGVVRWNSQEKTWDCPCHASRFDKTGHCIHGPAKTNLHPWEKE